MEQRWRKIEGIMMQRCFLRPVYITLPRQSVRAHTRQQFTHRDRRHTHMMATCTCPNGGMNIGCAVVVKQRRKSHISEHYRDIK